MDSEPVIIVNNITKVYPQKPQMMKLREDKFLFYLNNLLFRKRQSTNKFVALNNVSFSVIRGESIGVLGFNGAGKSTLLRVLAGITAPTNGTVTIRGKFGELFALNSGFKKDLSGRKNIYLLAAIKGISEHVIEERIKSIIEFSELEEFIDQPVKVYSSGMRGRLGFSILIHLLPDIIFIDEALSAGDILFNQKCQIELEKLVKQDKTLLIVSHSINQIRNLCSRVLWLHKGEIIMDGNVNEVLSSYENAKISKKI